MPIMADSHLYETFIKEQHLDYFGHVNNAVYLTLFEEARWDLITNNGYGLKEVLETQIGPIILQATVKFKKELRLREKVVITTRVTEYRRKIGYVHQEMTNQDGDLSTVADFTIGLFNLTTRELVSPTEGWLRAFGIRT